LVERLVYQMIVVQWTLLKIAKVGLKNLFQDKGQEASTCKCGDELSGSIKRGEHLD
jgi:hypothetical protein